MAEAEVGDDVYGDDPIVKVLEHAAPFDSVSVCFSKALGARSAPALQDRGIYSGVGASFCWDQTLVSWGSRRSRCDAVGRYEKGPGGNGIARRAMILAQLTLGLLPEAAAV